jgi:hypothetical protein
MTPVAEPTTANPQPVEVAIAPSGDLGNEPPAPSTSIPAAVEWVVRRMDQGDDVAAELLFTRNSDLTDEQRGQLALELIRLFPRIDPWVLARIVLNLPRSHQANCALNSLIAEWSRYDSEGVLRFLEMLPEDRVNSILAATAAMSLARLPAERVTTFASRLDAKGRGYLVEGLVALANQLGSWRNSSAILSKMNAQGRDDTVPLEWHLGQTLSTIAPDEVENWIASEPDPMKRDELLAGHAWVAGISNPKHGISLDAQIQQSQVRDRNLERHARAWLETDRNAALDWLQSEAAKPLMSFEVRAKFLKAYGLEATP